MKQSTRNVLVAVIVLSAMLAISACSTASKQMKDGGAATVVKCNNVPISIMNLNIGDSKECKLNLSLDGMTSAELTLAAWDIDTQFEAEISINDTVISLPMQVVGDTIVKKVKIPVDINVLKEGENVVKMKFASSPGGTLGYIIYELAITLMK